MSAAEEWRPVVGYEEIYEVSSHGRVRSLDRLEWVTGTDRQCGFSRRRKGRVLNLYRDKDGYLRVRPSIGGEVTGVAVHTLVCAAFHGARPEGYLVAHGDGSKDNNTAGNLRWATPLENSADMRLHGTVPFGEANYNAKLTEAQVLEIRQRACAEQPIDIARDYGVTPENVIAIRDGRTWRHLPHDVDEQRAPLNFGEHHHNAILTEDDVRVIKQRLKSERPCDIARDYPLVHSGFIYDIKAGRSWKHIPG